MTDDDKVPFLVLATFEAYTQLSQPFFVRAKTLSEAYAHVIANMPSQYFAVRLEGFVVGADQVAQLLDLKSLAKFYWDAGRAAEANPGLNVPDDTFESVWDVHGASPDPEDLNENQ